jgi:threonine dehydrogenase-like Zn-dependent dehydrogenase
MKAVAVFPAERAVRLAEHPAPALDAPASVRLRMLEAGVCGTDLEIGAFEYGTPPAGSPYLVLGHESLGEVVECGPAVERLRAGDLVVPMVRRPCPHPDCPACRAGRQDFCVSGDFTERGIRGAHGFMTEQVVDDERWMVPVPAALRDVGVLVEPLTIAEKALLQVAAVQGRMPWELRHPEAGGDGAPHRALVLGAGPVGLLGAMVLQVAGYRVYVYSRSASDGVRAQVLKSIGATLVAAETHTVAALAETVGNIDLVYEAVGASTLAFEVVKFLGINGTFVFTGVPGRKAPIRLDTDRVMRHLVLRNQVLFGTVNAGRPSYENAVRHLETFMARFPEATRALITSRSPLADAPGLLTTRPAGIKSVVRVE